MEVRRVFNTHRGGNEFQQRVYGGRTEGMHDEVTTVRLMFLFYFFICCHISMVALFKSFNLLSNNLDWAILFWFWSVFGVADSMLWFLLFGVVECLVDCLCRNGCFFRFIMQGQFSSLRLLLLFWGLVCFGYIMCVVWAKM